MAGTKRMIISMIGQLVGGREEKTRSREQFKEI